MSQHSQHTATTSAFISWIKVLRPLNLLMIAGLIAASHFGVIVALSEPSAPIGLDINLLLGTVYTLLAAAGGYLINDIYDMATDAYNRPLRLLVQRPHLRKQAILLYSLLLALGLIPALWLSLLVNHPVHVLVYLVACLGLFKYAHSWKSAGIQGNFMVSFLVAFIPWLPMVIAWNDLSWHWNIMAPLSFFTAVIFLINLSREWIKGIEDLKGDMEVGHKTIAVVLGAKRVWSLAQITLVFVLTLEILWLSGVIPCSTFGRWLASSPSIITIILILFIFRQTAVTSASALSLWLKILMIAGIFQVGFSNL